MANNHVCPWWFGCLLARPLRRLFEDPARVLAPFLQPGFTVLEPGPGMGFFTLELARLTGPAGRVVAVDIQPKRIEALKRRAARAGLPERIDARLAGAASMGIGGLAGGVGFALAFAVVHEVPGAPRFFEEVAAALSSGGRLPLAEPSGHVSAREFEAELAAAAGAGLRQLNPLSIRRSRAALLEKA